MCLSEFLLILGVRFLATKFAAIYITNNKIFYVCIGPGWAGGGGGGGGGGGVHMSVTYCPDAFSRHEQEKSKVRPKKEESGKTETQSPPLRFLPGPR